MSKRLQIVLDDAEMAEIRDAARQEKSTVSEWVRRSLRAARRLAPLGDADKKLAAVRAAARHSFPAGDVVEMLAEIERGYAGREAK